MYNSVCIYIYFFLLISATGKWWSNTILTVRHTRCLMVSVFPDEMNDYDVCTKTWKNLGPRYLPQRMPENQTTEQAQGPANHAKLATSVDFKGSPFVDAKMVQKQQIKLLYFVWSPPWHLYVLLLANLLTFYLAYLLAFYLAYLLAFYLTFYLAFYLAYLLAFYLAYLLTFYLAYHTFWHSIWHIFWHSIWHSFWHSTWHIWHSIWHIFWHIIWHIFWHLMAFYLAYLLAFYLTFYLAYLLAFYLAFEVQRCALSSEGPRLRSSGARWARQVPGWGPAVRTELGRS